MVRALVKEEAPLSVVKVMVEEDKADVHTVDVFGQTVTHLAKHHHEESLAVVKYLLSAGAKPNKQDIINSYLPIHKLSSFNNIPLIRC